jgi:hypothetical protein
LEFPDDDITSSDLAEKIFCRECEQNKFCIKKGYPKVIPKNKYYRNVYRFKETSGLMPVFGGLDVQDYNTLIALRVIKTELDKWQIERTKDVYKKGKKHGKHSNIQCGY